MSRNARPQELLSGSHTKSRTRSRCPPERSAAQICSDPIRLFGVRALEEESFEPAIGGSLRSDLSLDESDSTEWMFPQCPGLFSHSSGLYTALFFKMFSRFCTEKLWIIIVLVEEDHVQSRLEMIRKGNFGPFVVLKYI